MSLSSRYFLHRDGRDHGPFSRSELEFLWSEGRASGGDFVRPEDGSQGMLLRELSAATTETDDEEPWTAIGEPEADEGAEPFDHTFADEAAPEVQEFRGTTAPHVTAPEADRQTEPWQESEAGPAPLYEGHPSLLVYSGRLFWVAVFAAAAIWLERLGDFYMGAAALVSGLLLVTVLLHRGSCQYLITPLRIEASHGFFMAHSRELALADIRSIEIRRSGLTGLFNIGTIEFASSGSDRIEIVFHKVSRPARIKRLVHDLQDQSPGW